MAIQTQIITGRLSEPDGDPVASGSVRFTLSRYDATDNGVIAASRKVEASLEADGSITLELWPNTAGLRGTNYLVELVSKKGYVVETYGRIQVGESGPYSLADLLRTDAPPAGNTFWSSLTEAEYNAKITEMDTKAAEAALSAAQAALYDGVWLDDVATVIADTSLSYGPGASGVSEGDYVRTRAEGFSYQVAASGATDHHLTTAGGVKLRVLPGADGSYSIKAYGVIGDGTTDDSAAFQAALTHMEQARDANAQASGGALPVSNYGTPRLDLGTSRCNLETQVTCAARDLEIRGDNALIFTATNGTAQQGAAP